MGIHFKLQKSPFMGEDTQDHRDRLAKFIRDLCTYSSQEVDYVLCGESACFFIQLSSIFERQNHNLEFLSKLPVVGFLCPDTIDKKEACPSIVETSLCGTNEFFLMPKMVEQPQTMEEIKASAILQGVLS